MKSKQTGVTLIELVVAVLILSAALIPIGGLISKDTTNTARLSHSQYAMELARYTMDALLDAVDFDELLVGSPAVLTGASRDNFSSILFANSSGSCNGNIEFKGYLYNVSLKVIAIPDEDLGLTVYKNPPVGLFLQRDDNGEYNSKTVGSVKKTFFDIAIEKEQDSKMPSCFEDTTSIYRHDTWGEEEVGFDVGAYYEAQTPSFNRDNLMKGLILKISWNDKLPRQPLAKGTQCIDLVAHKARLKKNGS